MRRGPGVFGQGPEDLVRPVGRTPRERRPWEVRGLGSEPLDRRLARFFT